MNTKVKRIITVLLAAMLVVLAAGCSAKNDSSQTTDTPSVSEGVSEQQDANVTVETPYGKLEYPSSLEEIVRYDNVSSEGSDKYNFYALLDGEEIPVYSISFSKSELADAGDRLGTIKNSDVTTYVYLKPETDITNDSMTQEEKNLVFAAQETLNDVAASLNSIDGFTSEEPAG